MEHTILRVENLSKTYQSFRKEQGFKGALRSLFAREKITVNAVKPTSFTVAEGEFIGVLGPNGAGKTTMLKMLTGLIAPSGGTALAFGQFSTAKRERAYLRQIGMVMGQRNQLHPDLPATDSFRLAQAIYDIPKDLFQKRQKELVELLNIEDKLAIPVRKLSLGERMRLEIVLSMLHGPRLIFLDEPTIGLDFEAAARIRKFLRHVNETQRLTVLLTSHYPRDIEELCRRVILINHGTIVYDGALQDLDHRVQQQRQVSVVYADTGQGRQVKEFSCSATELGAELGKILSAAGPKVADLKIQEASIEDVFSRLFREKGST